MSTLTFTPLPEEQSWSLPPRGRVAMLSLIIGESAIFTIFVVAYIFYIGKSLNGPTPRQVLEIPLFNTICLLSSSFTIWMAERRIEKDRMRVFAIWWATTIALGIIFLTGTAREWHRLIYRDGLTLQSSLFGTTFYSLVGLHATHVVVGLLMLLVVLAFVLTGHVTGQHAERIHVLGLYWHFVDAVWVVVFTVVYVVGR
jgi:cytochrome c oxidase subunit III